MPKTTLSFYLHIIAVAVIVFAIGYYLMGRGEGGGSAVTTQKESAYQRVMRTKTLRCAYFIEPPFTIMDVATNTKSGIAVDLINQIGKEIGLNIEWVQEMSFPTMTEDLKNGRYDMVCGGLFLLTRAGRLDYSTPFSYVSLQGYVRADDARFDTSFADIDWPNTRVSGIDGEGSTAAVRKIIPQSKLEILPQNSQIAEMLLAVANNKTDIAFVLPTVFRNFESNNPGVLRPAKMDRPLYTYGVAFGLPVEETGLKNMIDIMIAQLRTSGELEKLVRHYDSVEPYTAIVKP